MTEEKKQEIVKSFYNCMIDKDGDCPGCPYDTKRIECGKKEMLRDVLDLIHRLQSENERLMERVFDCTAVIEYNEKCSKEIQAATILLEQRNKEIADRKAEIERLTELQSRGAYRVAELGIENAELQKQVDELKTKVEFEKEYGDIKVAQALADFKIWKQQAVKDTAKEILNDVREEINEGYIPATLKIKELAKRYGVEVE